MQKRGRGEKEAIIPEINQKALFFEPQGELPLKSKKKPAPSDAAHELRFDLKPHYHSPKSSDQAESSRKNAGENIGYFFTHVHSALMKYNGEARYRNTEWLLAGDDKLSFRPDIRVDGLKGNDYVEVKGKSLQVSAIQCRKAQVAVYAWALLRDYEKNKISNVNFAFFRYGSAHTQMKLHSKPHIEAMETLAQETKEGLIIPFNLLLFLLSNSKPVTRERDSESGGDQEYLSISGRAISLLQKMDEFDKNYFFEQYGKHVDNRQGDFYRGNRGRLERSMKFARKRSLHLDDLVAKHKMSDEIREMHYNGTPVQPFPVTIYSLRDPERWVRSFARNHEHILKALKVRDLYSEQKKELPF